MNSIVLKKKNLWNVFFKEGYKFKKDNNKGKDNKLRPKGGVSKKQKFLGECFNRGKQGHKSSECRLVMPQKYPRIFIIILLYIPGIKLSQTWVFPRKLINC